MSNRSATLVAATLEVSCPHDGCHASLPEPLSGSECWTMEEFDRFVGEGIDTSKGRDVTCVSCDQPFTVRRPVTGRVRIQ